MAQENKLPFMHRWIYSISLIKCPFWVFKLLKKKKKIVSRNISRRHIGQSTILFSFYNWCPAFEQRMFSQFYLIKSHFFFFFLNNTHNHWSKFKTSGRKHKPKKQAKHSYTPSLKAHQTSPKYWFGLKNSIRKQMLILQAKNTEPSI